MVDRLEFPPVPRPEVGIGRQVVDPTPAPQGRRQCLTVPNVRKDDLDSAGQMGDLAPRAARSRGPAGRIRPAARTRWLPMNPAPPVTIVKSVHDVLHSTAFATIGASRPIASHSTAVELLLALRSARAAPSTPASTQSANRSRRHEVGEAVAVRVAMALDLLPVDVDVRDAPLAELGAERFRASCPLARISMVSGLKTVL